MNDVNSNANKPRSGTRPFAFGDGRISGYASALFGLSALLGVLCFIFPEWLTTKEFRASLYSFQFAKNLLWLGIVIAFSMGIVSFILNAQKRLAATGITTAFLAVLLGAFNVQERAVQEVPFSFGVDWFILSLVFSTAIFIPIEKAFAQGLPVLIQFVACVFIADLFQAVTHRWYHQNAFLWKFHSIHHSSKNTDWLDGSRTHFVEALATRGAVIVPLYLIGFSEPALNAYVVLVGIQAVFVHANVRWDFGFLKYALVTPQYHHWHHSENPEYANTNYAVHLPLVDMLMGTFKLPSKMWPDTYGVYSGEPPKGFIRQLTYPLQRSSEASTE